MARWMVALLLLALPLAAGQAHDHSGSAERAEAAILLDVGSDKVRANDPALFTATIFGDDAVPEAHQDMEVQAWFDGRLLWATTLASGHDYDGVNHFTVTFPAPGPYSVRLNGAEGELARLDGWALGAETQAATAHADGPSEIVAGELGEFRFWPEDNDGRQVEHFYTMLEVRRPGELLYRVKLHGHDDGLRGPQVAHIAFPSPGTYTVEATLYQADPAGVQHMLFRPMQASREVQVLPSFAASQENPLDIPIPQTAPVSPVVVEGDRLRLVGTYDASPVVAPGAVQHLGILIQQPNGNPMGHLNLKGVLHGPFGTTFATEYLHETDGVFELSTSQSVPGAYVFEAATDDGVVLRLPFTVQADPISTMVVPEVDVDLPSTFAVGNPASAVVSLADALGRPVAHSELDVQLVGPSGVPYLMTKLHSHGDGRFAFTFTPLEEGENRLRLVPFGLDGQTLALADPLAWTEIPLEVESGLEWPVSAPPPQPSRRPPVEDGNAPIAPWIAAAGVLAAGLIGTLRMLKRR